VVRELSIAHEDELWPVHDQQHGITDPCKILVSKDADKAQNVGDRIFYVQQSPGSFDNSLLCWPGHIAGRTRYQQVRLNPRAIDCAP